MKKLRSLLVAVGIATCLAQADGAKTNTTVAVTAAGVTENSPLNPEERTQYADLVREELELSAQHKLLTELADEHLKRSAELKPTGNQEKSRWEGDLAQDFHDRSTLVLGQLNEFTKQRLAFEASHGGFPASTAALGLLNETKALNPSERAYVTKLDERQLKVRQELVLCDEATRTLYSQLLTNTSPETVVEISRQIDLNTRQAKQWEREQADVELRKLEFRAMRK